jgi:hypothetical protein
VYRKWLIDRCTEWSTTEGLTEAFTTACTTKFGFVPNGEAMSVAEAEDLLLSVGDDEVQSMRAATEDLYDGEFARYMTDNEGKPYAGFISCEFFGNQQVYAHTSHMKALRPGDKVRFAVHYNLKQQPQVSFVDRLNNRAEAGPKGSRGKGMPAAMPAVQPAGFPAVAPMLMGKGKGKGMMKGKGKGKKGMAPGALPGPGQVQPSGAMQRITLPDGTVVEGRVVSPPPGMPPVQAMPMHAPGPAIAAVQPMSNDQRYEGQRPNKPPDETKEVYTGRIARQMGDNGFIECAETKAAFGKDVYMWKTYFKVAGIGDTVQFQIHVSDKGSPQVSWLQRVAGTPVHAVAPMGMKRPAPGPGMAFPPGGYPQAKAPRLVATGPQLTTPTG